MPTHQIAVEGLHKSYGQIEVLKGISLAADKGQVITLIGSSGSGKSTLLRCLNLLEVPSAGKLSLEGQPINFQLRKGELVETSEIRLYRASLGMVFQSFNLWRHMTAVENVMAPLIHVLKIPKPEAHERAEQALHKVGLFERRDHYPSQLSGGQQQRAAIARALAIEPKVLLFDEPTSALDPELVTEVLNVITALAESGSTMLLVTHEMRFAREVSSKVAFLESGKIEEFGHPEQIFGAPKSERCAQFVSSITQ
ncbi:ATP-binding cassette domain-containing protein [Pseudophaeobacter sp.]|uniref:ATP-binding cassette domain-containing protein n=1 Tax=Pseudophaeobacter sp. TaxID=1971739 RepID=UPI004058C1E5